MTSTSGRHQAAGGYRRAMALLTLIVAGEAIFALPFHLPRYFRPTLLEVFGIGNAELGTALAVYGVVAMLCYFPGGPLADLFSARKLLGSSLVLSGLGGFYYASFPSLPELKVLYGFFGITSTLLFWSALIRSTREWGGPNQGRAYGFLDGGRGLFSAVISTALVALLAWMLPVSAEVQDVQRKEAFQAIIYIYTAICIGSAALVWFFIEERPLHKESTFQLTDFTAVVRLPAIWLQALIVVCAYVGYKGLDNISVYGVDVWGMNEVAAAQLASSTAWVRLVAALVAGLLADRFRASLVSASAFILLTASLTGFVLMTPSLHPRWLLFGNVIVSAAAVCGLRGVYYAMFEEASVPKTSTGSATGLVSVIGYAPDIFVGYITGLLIDADPGLLGHQRAFYFVMGFAFTGAFASIGLAWLCGKNSGDPRQPGDGVTS